MVADDRPPNWERRTHETRSAEYVDYVHDSGDVRVRVTPPENTGDGGYALDVTLFPYTDLSESYDVRSVASSDRADRIAAQFVDLFDGAYGGPGGVGEGDRSLEAAVAYALQRTRPAEAVDMVLPFREQ